MPELTYPVIEKPSAAPAGSSMSALSQARVGVVHDWLPVYAGAERVLEQMLEVVPGAELYSLIDFLEGDHRDFLKGRSVQTSFIQRMPWARKAYRYYLPLAPIAIEQFDMRGHDLVISSSYVVAKGVLTTADQLHISYVHSPIRYAWDLYFQYLREGNVERGLKGLLARSILHYLRLFDASSADRVDVFVANSKHVARRVRKTYRREAEVIYPPVDTDAFQLYEQKEDFYLTMSRLVPYKRIDLIVESFSRMPDKQLVVIGDGPEFNKIKEKAGPNVTLMGYQPHDVVVDYMQRARAFVFAAQEDFGIVPVEAQACGTPVVAYGRGGALETVVNGETGVFFREQSTEAIRDAVLRFEARRDQMEPGRIREHALTFSTARFQTAFQELIEREYEAFELGKYE